MQMRATNSLREHQSHPGIDPIRVLDRGAIGPMDLDPLVVRTVVRVAMSDRVSPSRVTWVRPGLAGSSAGVGAAWTCGQEVPGMGLAVGAVPTGRWPETVFGSVRIPGLAVGVAASHFTRLIPCVSRSLWALRPQGVTWPGRCASYPSGSGGTRHRAL